jgi:rod shape determining protein RodA
LLIERRMLRSLDPLLVFAVAGLILFGLVAVFSAGGSSLYYFKRQIVWTIIGCGIVVACLQFDYRYFGRFTRLLYIAGVGALAFTLFAGYAQMGAQRWLQLGSVPVQPSEFMKVILVITLAKHLEQHTFATWRDMLSPLIHAGIPMLFVLLQPDLGSTIIFGSLWLGMVFVAGAPVKQLAILTGSAAAVGGAALLASLKGWVSLIKPYQIKRILVFLDPYAYRYNEGYNIIQSMYAIGSGRFFGKGFLAGSQTQLNFLPARHTDFIFSVIGEEFGFLGALLLISLYMLFLWRTIRTIAEIDSRFGRLLIAGIFTMFLTQFTINVGMSLGVMPVTGKPLPFISYGGSASLANFAALGIIFNVNMRRRKIHFS